MVFITLYPWYFTPSPWYIDLPIHSILNPLPWVVWPPYPWYIGPPTHGNLTHLPMAYRTLLSMVYRTPYPMYFDLTAFGILNPMPMVFWHHLSMVVWPSNHGILTPLPFLLCTHYPRYIEPLIRGISNPLPMVIWILLPMVFGYSYPCYFYLPTNRISNYPWYPPIYNMLTTTHGIMTPYPWYIEPLPLVFWPPNPFHIEHQWYIEPPIHGLSNLLPIVFWPRYIWHIEPSSHGILSPLPMIFWLQYPWHIEPPIHGMLTPYLWYIEILSMVFWPTFPWYSEPLYMVFWPTYPWYFEPYSWYIEPSTHGISIYDWYTPFFFLTSWIVFESQFCILRLFSKLRFTLSSICNHSRYWLSYLVSLILLLSSTCLLNIHFQILSLWLLITSSVVSNFLSTYHFAHKVFEWKLFSLFHSKCNVWLSENV